MQPSQLLTNWPSLGKNLKLSVSTLIFSNLIPLFGVLFLGWSVFSIMILFWFENVIIGFYNVLKMALAKGTPPLQKVSPAAMHLSKLFFIPFFMVHYGIFTTVHGVFVFGMFGTGQMMHNSGSVFPGALLTMISEVIWTLLVPALVLFISHGVSFWVNYIRGGEYERLTAPQLMGEVYGRVVVLHIAIIAGGFTVVLFGSNVIVLMILIGLKTWIDVKAHLHQHGKAAEAATVPNPTY